MMYIYVFLKVLCVGKRQEQIIRKSLVSCKQISILLYNSHKLAMLNNSSLISFVRPGFRIVY